MTSPRTATARRDALRAELLDAGIGLADLARAAVSRVARPVARVAGSDLGRRLLLPPLRPLAERGRRVRPVVATEVDDQLGSLVPAVVEALVAKVDLNALVRDHVDLDGLVATVDVDAVADRLDLIGLANYVIDGVDLPEIIRQSSASFTSEAVRGARMQGIEADQAIARVVDRLLPHRRERLPRPEPNGHGAG